MFLVLKFGADQDILVNSAEIISIVPSGTGCVLYTSAPDDFPRTLAVQNNFAEIRTALVKGEEIIVRA